MYFRLTAVFYAVFALAILPNTLYSRDFYGSTALTNNSSFTAINDARILNNDCNYCHGIHGARKDAPALLNDREERYSNYLNSTTLLSGGMPAFDRDTSRKCPRSKTRNRR
jgi:hypothetical protein